MDISTIKEKIKKLLALADGGSGSSDNESYVALQKAQALMAEYKLSEKDIDGAKKMNCIQKKTTLCYGTRSSDHYLVDLADIIADNFCCVTYEGTTPGRRTHYIYFMGLEEDVTIAEEALHIANRAIIDGYNRVYKDMCNNYGVSYVPAKYFNPAKIGYTKGYLSGLKSALESQKERHEQEWGLVMVTPQEATDFMSSLKHVSYNNPNPVNHTYYDEGYADGKKFNMHKKVEGESTLKLKKGF